MEKTNYGSRQLLKKFIPYYKPYKGILAADLFASALTTVSQLVLPILLSYLTDWAQVGLLDANRVLKVGIVYAITKTIEVIARWFMQSIGHIMGAHIERDMRKDVFNHLLTMDTEFFNEARIGALMSRITTDLFDITEFSHHIPEEILVAIIKLIISFFVLFNINWKLTLIIYLIIPFMFIFSSNRRKRFRESTMNVKRQIGEINSGVEDTLLGISVVKSFANEGLEKDKFAVNNDKFVDIKRGRYFDMAGFFMITEVFAGIMYAILIFVGGFAVLNNKISPGDLVAFTMYLNMLIATVERILNFTDQYEAGITGIARFVEVMELDNQIYDQENATILEDVKGKIDFVKVYFKYPEMGEDEPYVLENIDFSVDVGENVALVGPSGAGKTTISKLIPRFYDVTKGSIKIDGQDIRDLTLESLRDNIGIVQQDVYLFSGTVKDNIRYGKDDATDEEIRRAAELAGATEFIDDLPFGFDTHIGERGVKLSGGQKQRLSIARVFL